MIKKDTINIDEKLSINKFNIDEINAHISLRIDPAQHEFDKLIICCPAGLYKRDSDGIVSFDYAGCLECGTCRILCGTTILEKWEYPQAGMGVSYRYG